MDGGVDGHSDSVAHNVLGLLSLSEAQGGFSGKIGRKYKMSFQQCNTFSILADDLQVSQRRYHH